MSYEVESLLKRTITVATLRHLLEDFDEDTPVLFSCDYGDRCHTEQALRINDAVRCIPVSQLQETGYSQTNVRVVPDNEVDFDEMRSEHPETSKSVVVVLS